MQLYPAPSKIGGALQILENLLERVKDFKIFDFYLFLQIQ